MATLKLDVVTAEGTVFSDEVELIVAPGAEGQLGILPHHTPLMTMLQPGELRFKKGGEDTYLAVSGGFLEVRPDRVIVLADTAERAEEIDRERAEEAKKRAEERMAHPLPGIDMARAEAALHRSIARLKVAEKRRRRTTQP
ncbi:MAG: F0F1 ATP synthase subunit epsilon [Chloroflexi bacterium]|nr:F0F1 ATP synthase subunit epsilon [Chloroflexota bacterium]